VAVREATGDVDRAVRTLVLSACSWCVRCRRCSRCSRARLEEPVPKLLALPLAGPYHLILQHRADDRRLHEGLLRLRPQHALRLRRPRLAASGRGRVAIALPPDSLHEAVYSRASLRRREDRIVLVRIRRNCWTENGFTGWTDRSRKTARGGVFKETFTPLAQLIVSLLHL